MKHSAVIFRYKDHGIRPFSGFGKDKQISAADPVQAFPNIFDAHVGHSVIQLSVRHKARTVINDMDFIILVIFQGADLHGARAFLALADTIADGILHQRLQGQGRHPEIGRPDVIFHLEGIAEAELLQGDIESDVIQLVFERDRLVDGDGIHVVAEVPGKIGDGLGGCLCIDQTDLLDHVEDIEEEMGLDLAEHQIHLELLVVPFLFPQDLSLLMYNEDQHDHHGDTGGQGHQVDAGHHSPEEKAQDGQSQVGHDRVPLAPGQDIAVNDQQGHIQDHIDIYHDVSQHIGSPVIEDAFLIRQDQVACKLKDQQQDDLGTGEDTQCCKGFPVLSVSPADEMDDVQGDQMGCENRKEIGPEGGQKHIYPRGMHCFDLGKLQQEKAQIIGQHHTEGSGQDSSVGPRLGHAEPDQDQCKDTDHDSGHFDHQIGDGCSLDYHIFSSIPNRRKLHFNKSSGTSKRHTDC